MLVYPLNHQRVGIACLALEILKYKKPENQTLASLTLGLVVVLLSIAT